MGLLEKDKPGESLKLAVKRMLPGGVLGRKQLTKVKIYAGEDHPHAAQNPKLKLDFKDSKYATGRRKKSIAKIWVKKGTGKIYVNGRTMQDYFTSGSHKMQITRPFEIINQATDYDVRCSVAGGGHTGQAGAMVHGIAKALVMFDENFKATLKTK